MFEQRELCDLALSYYHELFKSDLQITSPLHTSHSFPNLTEEEVRLLSADVTNEEIRAAAFDMGAFKAPGPDGLQAFFYQEYWSVVGQSVCDLVRDIFNNPTQVASLNETNLVLIPKVDQPEVIKDFRPISLCNVSSKILTKILSRRLKQIMGRVVGHHQCSFIAGRQSSDNVIVAQEVIH